MGFPYNVKGENDGEKAIPMFKSIGWFIGLYLFWNPKEKLKLWESSWLLTISGNIVFTFYFTLCFSYNWGATGKFEKSITPFSVFLSKFCKLYVF